MMYAYNASKHMAGRHTVQVSPAPAPETASVPVHEAQLAPHCQAELEIARRALEARRNGEPIDRLMRIQEIAFQAEPRRQRLEAVAARWYQMNGDEPSPDALSVAVVSDCERVSPAP